MYFNDAPTVVVEFFTGQAGLAVYFFTFLFTATTYLLAGMAREQVCTYMCPWPRIQGALVDQDTMAVTYEAWRGEPRGKHKKGDSWDDRGDCVDCKQCVAVCPTGIDIRDGFQLECIGCGLCIDACNDVMAKVGRPPNLIAYDSERNQERRAAGEPAVLRVLRPRTMVYVGVLALVAVVMAFAFTQRASTELSVIPERNPLFVTLADGSIRNGYDVKIINKEHSERAYSLSLAEDGLAATLSTPTGDDGDQLTLLASPDDVATHRVFVRVPADALTAAATPITMQLTDTTTGETRQISTVFRGPEP
jgi:cytochrome c oxidase accessory protein FixG